MTRDARSYPILPGLLVGLLILILFIADAMMEVRP